ncbi:phage holin family protein [Candidatus Gracilibacteria bacterium]|nr:phage holin family protein [Candidatus Gracilibacteria bacterium]MCF7898806.1 phage holin family protein [Candidatus Paceibacterota bacterium]
MKYIIIRTVGILIASYVTRVGVPLIFTSITLAFGTAWVALLTAIVLAVINHTIKPIFMLISIPVNLVTLGLFSFVINGFMILLADKLVPEFAIPSLLMAIYFSIVLSVINWVLHIFE